jgi:hypothetical protein
MHAWILLYSDKDERHRGEYKKIPIRIEAFNELGKSIGIIFETVSPLETPLEMEELIDWFQNAFERKKVHPLLAIGLLPLFFSYSSFSGWEWASFPFDDDTFNDESWISLCAL